MYSLSHSYTTFPFLRLGKAQCTAYQIFYSFPGRWGGRRGNAPTPHRLIFLTDILGINWEVTLQYYVSDSASASPYLYYLSSSSHSSIFSSSASFCFLSFPLIPSFSLLTHCIFPSSLRYYKLFSLLYLVFLHSFSLHFISPFFLRLQLVCLTLSVNVFVTYQFMHIRECFMS